MRFSPIEPRDIHDNTNPIEHVVVFQAQMSFYVISYALVFQSFLTTLWEAAQE